MQVFILRDNTSIEERARALACQIAINYKTPTRGTTFPDFPTKDWFTSDAEEILNWIGPLNAKEAERRLTAISMSYAHSHEAGRQTRKRLMIRADAIYDFISGDWKREAEPVVPTIAERVAKRKAKEAEEAQKSQSEPPKKKAPRKKFGGQKK
jgi:hypothetical protein